MDKTVGGVEWANPPAKVSYNWKKIANQLRSRPMEWGKVFDRDRVSVANAVRQGSIAAVHPRLGFEVQTTNNQRTADERTCTLFLRFNPDAAEVYADREGG